VKRSYKLTTLKINGEWLTHGKSLKESCFGTLCGLKNSGFEIETPSHSKINCPACYELFITARLFRLIDFEVNL